MAWEDRTRKEKAEARRQAREYAATDDDYDYVVTWPDKPNFRVTVHGINSAKAVAGKTGTYHRK